MRSYSSKPSWRKVFLCYSTHFHMQIIQILNRRHIHSYTDDESDVYFLKNDVCVICLWQKLFYPLTIILYNTLSCFSFIPTMTEMIGKWQRWNFIWEKRTSSPMFIKKFSGMRFVHEMCFSWKYEKFLFDHHYWDLVFHADWHIKSQFSNLYLYWDQL